MHTFSVLTLAQLTLVLLGVIFQVVAMMWLYRDSSGERKDGEHAKWGEDTIDLGNRKRSKVRSRPRDTVHDYYEMEKTPPGVRPADLRKTARVTYMDNINVADTPHPDEPA